MWISLKLLCIFFTGAASTLAELRKDLEARTGLSGKELRIEKICYTGKEGKTAQGCPMAKWVSVWIATYNYFFRFF